MASYTVVTTTAANVADVNVINSTRVRIVANNACVYNVNAAATLSSNIGPLIPANRPTDIILSTIGQRVSVLPTNGASTVITLTEIGTVYQSAINQNSTTFLNP